jgi:hypothetical protein
VRNDLAHRTTDWHDNESVHAGAAFVAGRDRFGNEQRDEFYRYAAWQRAARHAMDNGITDWHGWASDHTAEFALTVPATA